MSDATTVTSLKDAITIPDTEPVFPDYLWLDDKTGIDGLFPWAVIAEQLPSGLFIIDACTYAIVYCNTFAAQHLREPVVEKRAAFLHANQILDKNERHFSTWNHPVARALLNGDTVSQQEVLFVREDAVHLFLGLNVAPLRSPEGVIVAALCTFDDISSRMLAEQRINQQTEHLLEAMEALQVAQEDLIIMRSAVEMERQRYQELFEFATSGYLITDLNGIIREANHAAIRCLGITPQYAVGKILVNLVAFEDRIRFRLLLHQLSNMSQISEQSEQSEQKEGGQIAGNRTAEDRMEWEGRLVPQHLPPLDIAFTVSPFRKLPDHPIRLRWLLRDLTNQKRLEKARQVDQQHLLEQERKSATYEERNRIAQEFHDTLAQGFTGIAFLLAAAEDAVKNAPDLAKTHISRARSVATDCIAEARRTINDMRAQSLESGNLPLAFALLVEEKRRNSPIPIDLQVEGVPVCLPVQAENDLLRIGQEAITNALKHAHAEQINVFLIFSSHNLLQEIILRVEDNGLGMQTQNHSSLISSSSQGYGLIGMHERARRINASFSLESSPGNGTRIKVTMMLPTMTIPI